MWDENAAGVGGGVFCAAAFRCASVGRDTVRPDTGGAEVEAEAEVAMEVLSPEASILSSAVIDLQR